VTSGGPDRSGLAQPRRPFLPRWIYRDGGPLRRGSSRCGGVRAPRPASTLRRGRSGESTGARIEQRLSEICGASVPLHEPSRSNRMGNRCTKDLKRDSQGRETLRTRSPESLTTSGMCRHPARGWHSPLGGRLCSSVHQLESPWIRAGSADDRSSQPSVPPVLASSRAHRPRGERNIARVHIAQIKASFPHETKRVIRVLTPFTAAPPPRFRLLAVTPRLSAGTRPLAASPALDYELLLPQKQAKKVWGYSYSDLFRPIQIKDAIPKHPELTHAVALLALAALERSER
jgi:hypothetical protein